MCSEAAGLLATAVLRQMDETPSPCQAAQTNRPAIWLTNLTLLSSLLLPHSLSSAPANSYPSFSFTCLLFTATPPFIVWPTWWRWSSGRTCWSLCPRECPPRSCNAQGTVKTVSPVFPFEEHCRIEHLSPTNEIILGIIFISVWRNMTSVRCNDVGTKIFLAYVSKREWTICLLIGLSGRIVAWLSACVILLAFSGHFLSWWNWNSWTWAAMNWKFW